MGNLLDIASSTGTHQLLQVHSSKNVHLNLINKLSSYPLTAGILFEIIEILLSQFNQNWSFHWGRFSGAYYYLAAQIIGWSKSSVSQESLSPFLPEGCSESRSSSRCHFSGGRVLLSIPQVSIKKFKKCLLNPSNS